MMTGGRGLVERFYEQFNRGELDQAVELFHPDVVTVEPILGRVTTRDAWRAHGERVKAACPAARLLMRSSVEEPGRVAVEGSFVGTFTSALETPDGPVSPTGRAFDVEFADFFEITENRVKAHRVYYDQMDFLGQLGLLPEPGAGTASPG